MKRRRDVWRMITVIKTVIYEVKVQEINNLKKKVSVSHSLAPKICVNIYVVFHRNKLLGQEPGSAEFLLTTYCWMEVKTQTRSQCWQNTFCLLFGLVPCSLLLCIMNLPQLHQVYRKRCTTGLKNSAIITISLIFSFVWMIWHKQKHFSILNVWFWFYLVKSLYSSNMTKMANRHHFVKLRLK